MLAEGGHQRFTAEPADTASHIGVRGTNQGAQFRMGPPTLSPLRVSPLAISPQAVMQLQRLAGNAAVEALLTVQREMDEDGAMAAIDSLPAEVLRGGGAAPLTGENERHEFLRAGRGWFGSNDATIAHFSAIERCNVPGGPFLHRDARQRLEAVQGALGGAGAMPTTTTAFSFRNPFTANTHYDSTSMHTLGYALDYDAFNMPNIGRPETAELVETVTGQPSHAELGDYVPRRNLIRQTGEATASGEAAPKDAQPFLDRVTAEATRLAQTSQAFQASLGPSRDRFLELRTQFFEAGTPAQRNAIMAQVPNVITSWTGALNLQKLELLGLALIAGMNRDSIPGRAVVQDQVERLAEITRTIASLQRSTQGNEPPPRSRQRSQVEHWEAEFGLNGNASAPFAERLSRLSVLVSVRRMMLVPLIGAREHLARIDSVLHRLTTPEFLFGRSRTTRGQRPTTASVVESPSMAQMVEHGFFNPGQPIRGIGRFNAQFMVEMARHGFELGASWTDKWTDSMHFELVIVRPHVPPPQPAGVPISSGDTRLA